MRHIDIKVLTSVDEAEVIVYCCCVRHKDISLLTTVHESKVIVISALDEEHNVDVSRIRLYSQKPSEFMGHGSWSSSCFRCAVVVDHGVVGIY